MRHKDVRDNFQAVSDRQRTAISFPLQQNTATALFKVPFLQHHPKSYPSTESQAYLSLG